MTRPDPDLSLSGGQTPGLGVVAQGVEERVLCGLELTDGLENVKCYPSLMYKSSLISHLNVEAVFDGALSPEDVDGVLLGHLGDEQLPRPVHRIVHRGNVDCREMNEKLFQEDGKKNCK